MLGVTAALGRADLIQVHVLGALANHELTVEQLDEATLFLAYYAGWENATAVAQGVAAALTSFTAGEQNAAAPSTPIAPEKAQANE